MKILFLTQYYPPETGAPQNRLSSLAFHLKSFGNHVEVLTALPNYPIYEIFNDYKNKKKFSEIIDGIKVYRSKIYVSKKKAIHHRLLNYFSFAFNAYFTAKKNITKPDIIICESPPLFLGITALRLKKKWKCKLVFNVSDLWPESAEKMGLVKNKFVLKQSYKLANKIYKNADLISGQTQGIIDVIRKHHPAKKMFWLPNGIEERKFTFLKNEETKSDNKFNLLYAGIIGHAQGLEVILHAAKILKTQNDIHFYIIGDGPVKDDLIAIQKENDLSNVSFLPNQTLEKIAIWLQKCSAYIIPLRKLDLFKGAIPSKIFEPLFFANPILLGVEGEAKKLFIDDANSGLFFEPENADELAKAILTLYHDPILAKLLGNNGKNYVIKNFQRKKIADRFWNELQRL